MGMFVFSIDSSHISRLRLLNNQKIALKELIDIWETKLTAVQGMKPIQIEAKDRPCCIKWIDADCDDCPIRQFTGQKYCRDTPFVILEQNHIFGVDATYTPTPNEVCAIIDFLFLVLANVKKSIRKRLKKIGKSFIKAYR
jgi:hypothetical protein